MYFEYVQPSGFLNRYIRYYCLMEAEACEENISERVVPVDNIQLMFHYRQPFAVLGGGGRAVIQPRTIISGLTNSFSDVVTRRKTGVIFVAFKPGGACYFFNFPLSEIENQSIDLADIYGSEIRDTEELLFHKKTTPEKIKVVESFLFNRFSPIASHNEKLIVAAIKLINAHGGQISALALSEQLSVTTKSLERKFAGYVGKTPKQFARLVRFRRTIQDLQSIKNTSLTEYAYLNGYTDQSHFIRDFKMYSGFTPGEFQRNTRSEV